MPVFKPRNRLVNFRLSEEEFEKLRASCSLYGARSLSDFARAAVMRSVSGGAGHSAPDVTETTIDRKVTDLETRIGELHRLVESLRHANLAPVAAHQGE
ncbi:MAG: hypothetical protein JNK48_20965 [Bryobacterales bacterium]|nr:hypothetical protein [Bryobacterales bacterium]